jgi:hypothetical protein
MAYSTRRLLFGAIESGRGPVRLVWDRYSSSRVGSCAVRAVQGGWGHFFRPMYPRCKNIHAARPRCTTSMKGSTHGAIRTAYTIGTPGTCDPTVTSTSTKHSPFLCAPTCPHLAAPSAPCPHSAPTHRQEAVRDAARGRIAADAQRVQRGAVDQATGQGAGHTRVPDEHALQGWQLTRQLCVGVGNESNRGGKMGQSAALGEVGKAKKQASVGRLLPGEHVLPGRQAADPSAGSRMVVDKRQW